jgi:TRAP-type C4-dicarboxylate transport system substrate-binding protein
MAFGDVYSALQTGVIGAAENNLPSYGPYGVRHYEVAPNYTFDSHSRVPEVVVVSLKTWQTLSPRQQRWLRQAARDSVAVEEAAWERLVAKTRQALRGKVHFFHVDVSRFQQAMQPVYRQYQRRYGNLIERILDAQQSSGS